jgi:hypothetical protein
MKSTQSSSLVRCAFCHDSSSGLGACTFCGAAHHPDCYVENANKCASCGRGDEKRKVKLVPQPMREQDPNKVLLWVALVVALLGLILIVVSP